LGDACEYRRNGGPAVPPTLTTHPNFPYETWRTARWSHLEGGNCAGFDGAAFFVRNATTGWEISTYPTNLHYPAYSWLSGGVENGLDRLYMALR
jgi:hypothetical protein